MLCDPGIKSPLDAFLTSGELESAQSGADKVGQRAAGLLECLAQAGFGKVVYWGIQTASQGFPFLFADRLPGKDFLHHRISLVQFGHLGGPFILIGLAIHLQPLGADEDEMLVADFVFFLAFWDDNPAIAWARPFTTAAASTARFHFFGFVVVDAAVVETGDVADEIVNPEFGLADLGADAAATPAHLRVFHRRLGGAQHQQGFDFLVVEAGIEHVDRNGDIGQRVVLKPVDGRLGVAVVGVGRDLLGEGFAYMAGRDIQPRGDGQA